MEANSRPRQVNSYPTSCESLRHTLLRYQRTDVRLMLHSQAQVRQANASLLELRYL